jgi:hypothetical protein
MFFFVEDRPYILLKTTAFCLLSLGVMFCLTCGTQVIGEIKTLTFLPFKLSHYWDALILAPLVFIYFWMSSQEKLTLIVRLGIKTRETAKEKKRLNRMTNVVTVIVVALLSFLVAMFSSVIINEVGTSTGLRIILGCIWLISAMLLQMFLGYKFMYLYLLLLVPYFFHIQGFNAGKIVYGTAGIGWIVFFGYWVIKTISVIIQMRKSRRKRLFSSTKA